MYAATDRGPVFVDVLEAPYAESLRERAEWVVHGSKSCWDCGCRMARRLPCCAHRTATPSASIGYLLRAEQVSESGVYQVRGVTQLTPFQGTFIS